MALRERGANGASSQSIVWGFHPDTLKPYTFVVKQPVIAIPFESLKWPPEIANPPTLASCTEEPEDTEATEAPEATKEPEVIAVGWLLAVRTLEDALRVSVPTRVHENNNLLFVYARAVKALEMQQGKFTPEQRRDAFDQWHARATPFLRPGQSKEDYWFEFLNAYQRAKYPLGSLIIPKAWKLAQSEPLPSEALQFENPQRRLLVALCWQLQILNGDQPFYLSSRTCQQLFHHESHSTAAKWLTALCVLGIIKEIEKGNAIRASRYRYMRGSK